LVCDVRHGHLLLEARRDGEEVVLDDEDHRQLVDGREVDRLVEVAGARRRIAAKGEDDVLLFQVADRQRETDGMRELRADADRARHEAVLRDRKSTRLNSSHVAISYAVFCLKKKKKKTH